MAVCQIRLSRWRLHNAGGSVLSVTNWHRGREIESLNVRFQPTRFWNRELLDKG